LKANPHKTSAVNGKIAGSNTSIPYRITLEDAPLTSGLRSSSEADGAARFELAEQDFREANRLARSMSAQSPELRATISLARLLDQRGRRDEAGTMLAESYGWFTEGFDAADLKEAKALLEELR